MNQKLYDQALIQFSDQTHIENPDKGIENMVTTDTIQIQTLNSVQNPHIETLITIENP